MVFGFIPSPPDWEEHVTFEEGLRFESMLTSWAIDVILKGHPSLDNNKIKEHSCTIFTSGPESEANSILIPNFMRFNLSSLILSEKFKEEEHHNIWGQQVDNKKKSKRSRNKVINKSSTVNDEQINKGGTLSTIDEFMK